MTTAKKDLYEWKKKKKRGKGSFHDVNMVREAYMVCDLTKKKEKSYFFIP